MIKLNIRNWIMTRTAAQKRLSKAVAKLAHTRGIHEFDAACEEMSSAARARVEEMIQTGIIDITPINKDDN